MRSVSKYSIKVNIFWRLTLNSSLFTKLKSYTEEKQKIIRESIKKLQKNINQLRETEKCLIRSSNAGVEVFISDVPEDIGGDFGQFVEQMLGGWSQHTELLGFQDQSIIPSEKTRENSPRLGFWRWIIEDWMRDWQCYMLRVTSRPGFGLFWENSFLSNKQKKRGLFGKTRIYYIYYYFNFQPIMNKHIKFYLTNGKFFF